MKRLQRLLLPLLGATSLWTTGCDRTHVVDGGSDDTHSSLRIQGRVLTQDAKALPNVVVRLRHLGLSDTTGTDGAFSIEQESGFDSNRKDTLDYFREGEPISSVAVPNSVWTAPDIYVIQRDFSGTISGNTFRIHHVAGQIRLPDGTFRNVEMDWNRPQRRYSGFASFPITQRVDTFSILVWATDSLDRICGKSDTVRFTSRSGNVAVPDFGAENSLPSLAMTAIGEWEASDLAGIAFPSAPAPALRAWEGQTLRVVARAEGMIEQIDHAEWSLDRSNWTSRNSKRILGTNWARWDTLVKIRTPKTDHDTMVVWLKAVLKNGLQILDSIRIAPAPFLPSATIYALFPDGYERLEGVPPGAPMKILLEDLDPPFTKIVSRTVVCGRIAPDYSRPGYFRLDLVGQVERVTGKDTVLPAPSRSGNYAYLFQIEYANGTVVADTCSPFLVLDPGPRIQSAQVQGDSIVVRWTDSVPSSKVTRLRFVSEPYGAVWHEDTVTVPAQRTVGSFRLPTDCKRLRLSIDHPFSFRQDTTFTIPRFPWTFSGASTDTSRLKAWAEGIGGFRAYAEGGIGQLLMGEVARLRWFREDSSDLDGGAIHFQVPTDLWNANDSSRVSDTLSFDIASPSGMDLVVEAATTCLDFWSQKSLGSIQWTLPKGVSGRVHLPLSDTRWSSHFGSGESGNFSFCSTTGFTVTATQTTGPRARQGFLEVDNVLWH